jgi:hypothetical protein
MTYRKPEIVTMAPAVAAIQSDTQKVLMVRLDFLNQQAASFAYEADE